MSTSYTGALHGAPFLLLLFLTACAGTLEREEVTQAQAHMYAHFDRAVEVHDALVRGNLEEAKVAADWLANHPREKWLPEGADAESAMMRRYAGRVSQATSLGPAATATAQMGQACGACHATYGVDPRFLIGTAPPEGTGPKAEMARHVWAAERMWEGLVGPQDYAWESGAAALKGGWLNPGDLVAAPQDSDRLRTLTQKVYTLGSEAEACTDAEEKAEIYGEFLTTCIDCHRMTGAIIR